MIVTDLECVFDSGLCVACHDTDNNNSIHLASWCRTDPAEDFHRDLAIFELTRNVIDPDLALGIVYFEI